jgi:hypothetical protein
MIQKYVFLEQALWFLIKEYSTAIQNNKKM